MAIEFLDFTGETLTIKAEAYRFHFDAVEAVGEITPASGSDESAMLISFVPLLNDRLPSAFAFVGEVTSKGKGAEDAATIRLKYSCDDRDVVIAFRGNEDGISFSYEFAHVRDLRSLVVGPMKGRFAQVYNFDPDLERFDIPEKVGARLQISSRKGTYGSFFQLDQGSYMMPPYLFALHDQRQYIGVGLLDVPATPIALDAQVNIDRVTLRFDYSAAPQDGEYKPPGIAICIADSPEGILDGYLASIPEVARVEAAEAPQDIPQSAIENPQYGDWWTAPIYTTWGDQVYRKHIEEGNFPSEAAGEKYLTAELVNSALARLKEKNIEPKTIVLDEGWSRGLGDWAPDDAKFGGSLAGFISELHARGYHVVLHFNPFLVKADSAVVAAQPEVAVRTADGKPRIVARSGANYLLFDWTNPAARKHLGSSLERMVAAHGLNADGVKVSGTKFLPEPTDVMMDPSYGRGEQYLLAVLRDLNGFVKRAKPDAPVSLACLNPLFARHFDIVRLGNTSEVNHEIYAQRARTASWLIPNKPIDTDDWASFMKVIGPATAMKAVCGIPNIFSAFYRGDGRYRVQGASGGAPIAIPDEVYNLIASVWKVYEQSRDISRERLNVDFNRMEFSTQGEMDEALVRTYQGGNILAVYCENAIILTSLLDTKAIIELPDGFEVASIARFDRSGKSEEVPFQICLSNRIIFRAQSCRGEALYCRIQGKS